MLVKQCLFKLVDLLRLRVLFNGFDQSSGVLKTSQDLIAEVVGRVINLLDHALSTSSLHLETVVHTHHALHKVTGFSRASLKLVLMYNYLLTGLSLNLYNLWDRNWLYHRH